MKKLMLYIHIPFCEKKCYYCDFVSFPSSLDTIDKYIKILLKEIETKRYLANDYEISSIYIGGGTPSFIPSKYINFILESIKNNYKLSINCEISIELNPHSALIDKLKVYYNVGINRLSFGLQSTNDDELRILGRIHNYKDFLNSYNDALHIGFKNINVDIINGIPMQTPSSYEQSLKRIFMLHINHISIYNLIIEPGTVFNSMYQKGELRLPNEDNMLEIDNITKDLTSYYRLNRYEISNYSKEGFECKHNLGYWSMVEYLGFGLNASSFYNNKRYKNFKNIYKYLDLKYEYYITDTNKEKYYEEINELDKKDLMNDFVMLGFRKTKGIDSQEFYTTFNEKFEKIFDMPLNKYLKSGFIIKNDHRYYFTNDGLNISNTILSDFLI